ncbi:MAG: diguanylate cyclase, partial [Gammaproteobacteria bacterium]
ILASVLASYKERQASMDAEGLRVPLDIHRKQAEYLFRNKLASPSFHIGAAAILATFLWPSIATRSILIWFLSVVLINVGRVFLAFFYTSRQPENKTDIYWINVHVASAAVAALGWGSVVVITPLDNLTHQILVLVMAGALAVLALPSLVIVKNAFTFYLISLIVPIAAKVFVTAESIDISIASLAFIFIGATYYAGREISSAISEAFRNELAVERLAHSDQLTKLANRRMFDEMLVKEWDHALRGSTMLSLVLLDIDNFKRYNDGYGHSKGDKCLRTVADALRTALPRGTDILARYGGEEFAVILPFTDVSGGQVVSERMRKAVEALRLPHKHSTVGTHLTITAGGVTCQPAPDMKPTRLIELADLALYQAKGRGKNRVEWGDWKPESGRPEFTLRQRKLTAAS